MEVESKIAVTESTNLAETLPDLDVIYMTRIQKERFADLAEYEKVKGSYMLGLREARAQSAHRSAVREVAVVSLFTAALLGLAVGAEGVSLAIPSAADAGWLLSYGIVSHCVGWLLIAGSLPRVSPATAGLALLLQPTLSFAWDVLFFARGLTVTELVGAAIVLGAIYLGSR